MSMTNTYELLVLDHVLGGPDFARPATVYAALFTTAPGETGGGTEVTGGSYARVAVTNNATNFPAATTVSGTGTKTNGTDITFPTASADWGTVRGVALMTASSGGSAIAYCTITATPIYSGATPKIKATKLKFTMN
jgi:hypothetical protein